jgi:Tfp pilus assembly protein PilN
MRAVNLLPRDLAKQKRISQQQLPAVVGAGLGVVVTGALALSFMGAAGHVRDAQTALDAKLAELQALPKPAKAKTPENANLAGEQSARLTAVSTALSARLAWDRILREFSLILPGDVWVTSLSMTNPDPAQAATGPQNNFSLSGYTYSHDSVARLLARLALIPELSGINLTSSQLQQAGTPGASGAAGTVQFNVTAAVKLPPGAVSTAPAPPAPAPAPSTDTTSTDTTSTGAGA